MRIVPNITNFTVPRVAGRKGTKSKTRETRVTLERLMSDEAILANCGLIFKDFAVRHEEIRLSPIKKSATINKTHTP